MATTPFRGEIYAHTNLLNGKSYVGQTTAGMESRWKDHVKHSRYSKTATYNTPFARALRKYGPEAFEHQILSRARSKAELDNLEKVWIILLQSREQGYNLGAGGEGNPGLKHTPETKARISKNRTGKGLGYTFNRGRAASTETRRKRGASNRRRKFSEEHKDKIRQTRVGVKRPDVTAWNNARWSDREPRACIHISKEAQRARELLEKSNG